LPAEFEPLFDVPAAQHRFATSQWIAGNWPDDLRQSTTDAFVIRDIADRYLISLTRPDRAKMYREIEFIIRRTPYRALVTILMNSDARMETIAARAQARGISSPLVLWIEGVRALSERRFHEAATLLGEASRNDPANREWAQDAAFARSFEATPHP